MCKNSLIFSKSNHKTLIKTFYHTIILCLLYIIWKTEAPRRILKSPIVKSYCQDKITDNILEGMLLIHFFFKLGSFPPVLYNEYILVTLTAFQNMIFNGWMKIYL